VKRNVHLSDCAWERKEKMWLVVMCMHAIQQLKG